MAKNEARERAIAAKSKVEELTRFLASKAGASLDTVFVSKAAEDLFGAYGFSFDAQWIALDALDKTSKKDGLIRTIENEIEYTLERGFQLGLLYAKEHPEVL